MRLVSPKVSILIVSYNVKQYIIHCIDSIKKSDYEGEIEIIVIDNNSFDGSLDAIKSKMKNIICIQNNENIRFGKAVNQAAKIATGEYYLVLNPDTIIEESTISTFVNYLSENSIVGMAGPKIVNSDGSLQKGSKRSFPTIVLNLLRRYFGPLDTGIGMDFACCKKNPAALKWVFLGHGYSCA